MYFWFCIHTGIIRDPNFLLTPDDMCRNSPTIYYITLFIISRGCSDSGCKEAVLSVVTRHMQVLAMLGRPTVCKVFFILVSFLSAGLLSVSLFNLISINKC